MQIQVRCLLFLLSITVATPAVTQVATSQKSAQIRQLIDITGSAKMALQFGDAMANEMESTLKRLRPDIPERAIVLMRQEMMTLFSERLDAPGGLIDKVIQIYDKHFTLGEIEDMLAFYRTPTGKRLIATMPAVMTESMVAGQAWGQGLGAEAAARTRAVLKQEGIELPRK